MKPVRTAASNFVYRGPTPDIGDAWVERRRREGAVYLTWELSPEERQAIADGAQLQLGIYGMEPIPPVSLEATFTQPLSQAGADLRDRALRTFVGLGREDSRAAPGWWEVSHEVWQALNAEHALDPADGVPTLWGRPILEVAGTDVLTFHAGEQEGRA